MTIDDFCAVLTSSLLFHATDKSFLARFYANVWSQFLG
jgi:hypothetical protein